METTDRMLAKVQALIAKAEATDNTAEAETYFAKAEQLMTQYQISEAMLEATRPAAQRMKPGRKYVAVCEKSHLDDQFVDLVQRLAVHYGCRVLFYGLGYDYARDISVDVHGFESALRSFELSYTALHLDLARQLTPKPDPSRSFDENVYVLHEAGVKWRDIADAMNRTYNEISSGSISDEDTPARRQAKAWRAAVRESKKEPGVLVPWPDGHRLINAYKRWCAEIGDAPRAIQSPVTYQRNFAEGYVNRVAYRLREMRRKEERAAGAGSALVLRQDAVDEAFEETHPDRDTYNGRRAVRYLEEARTAGDEAGQRADLGGTRVQNERRGELG